MRAFLSASECVAGLVFDPYLPYKGEAGDDALSYYDIMLAPLIGALSEVMEADTKVNPKRRSRADLGVLLQMRRLRLHLTRCRVSRSRRWLVCEPCTLPRFLLSQRHRGAVLCEVAVCLSIRLALRSIMPIA